jgi:cell shape-determining protein MreD
MRARHVISGEVHVAPHGLNLAVRVLVLDYAALALQGSVMAHFQTPYTACDLTLLAAIFIGLRLGPARGAANGLLLGLTGGALMAEPTGIPALIAFMLGWVAGASREGFQVERRAIRVWLALSLLVAGEIVSMLLQLIVWQRLPVVLPLSLILYALLAPAVESTVGWLLPED